MARLINKETVFHSKLWMFCPWKSFNIKENTSEIGEWPGELTFHIEIIWCSNSTFISYSSTLLLISLEN